MTEAPQRDIIMPATKRRRRRNAAPRIKFTPHGYAIDHPDPVRGERLMMKALGVADRDAMDGILKQLVMASVSGETFDETGLSFMLAMLASIRPRDSIEAMLVTQMVAVHALTMRCAYRLACADNVVAQDSAARALDRLVRTFPAQLEALSRYRGESGITVQNLSIQHGGKAIVGNVTHHAGLLVTDASAAALPALSHAATLHQAEERELLPVEASRASRA
jgi:hypothetical protein